MPFFVHRTLLPYLLVATVMMSVGLPASAQSLFRTADTGEAKFTRLPFKVEVSLREGYDDNITTSSVDEAGSWFSDFDLGIQAAVGNERTKLTLNLNGGFVYY